MANYITLKTAIQAVIKTNNNNEITGKILQQQLLAMVNSLGSDYQLAGILRPLDTPKTDDQRIAYLAVEPGMYEHAGGFDVTELSLLTYDVAWEVHPLGVPFGSQIASDITAAVEVEKTRAMAAEKKLGDAIATETTERKAADAALDNDIKAETKRATDAEGVLAKAVETEKTRAIAEEKILRDAITAEADARAEADTTLQGNINAEKTRAMTAEATLTKNINTETAERKAADTALDTRVTAIESKIPAQATAENKLADKEFVNSSIATATATFRGTFETLEALKATTADKNDYAFWVHKDDAGNTCYDKYTYTGTEWLFEYRLNNSSFTAAQWAALNSGVTADVIKALQDVDKANAKAIADEKAERAAAITAEQQARAQADETNANAIATEVSARKDADNALQTEVDKKVNKDDRVWLENFMPRIQLKGDGSTSAPTVGDNLVANYQDTSWLLGHYGGVVTAFDDETVHGRVVQVKHLNDNKLFVTAIFNSNANFLNDFSNSFYEIVLNFGTDGAFTGGAYRFQPLGKVFFIDYSYEPDRNPKYDSDTDGVYVKEAIDNGDVIMLRREDGIISYPSSIISEVDYIDLFWNDGPNDEGFWTALDFTWNDLGGSPDIVEYTLDWNDKQDVIPDLETIRTQAKNGQTAFGWGDHSKAGYAKTFVITLTTGSGTIEDPYNVDKRVQDVQNAIDAKSLIYLYKPTSKDLYPAMYIAPDVANVSVYFAVTWADDNALWAFYLGTNAAGELFVEKYEFSYVVASMLATINGKSLINGGEDIKVGVPTIQAGTGENAEVFNGKAPSDASGENSHAEGIGGAKATGMASHAEGAGHANGFMAHAEGNFAQADGVASHAEGLQTIAKRSYSHAEGECNVEDPAAIHQVGIGAGVYERKDAHRITYDGKHYVPGIGGFDGTKATANLTNEKDLATVINELQPIVLNYNGLGDNNEPLFVDESGAALTRAQICAILKGHNANQVVLKNKAAGTLQLQTSTAKFLQVSGATAFMIGFEGANADGQIFDILYKWDAVSAKVLRAELLYNPQAQ